jgi:hypothetical protein
MFSVGTICTGRWSQRERDEAGRSEAVREEAFVEVALPEEGVREDAVLEEAERRGAEEPRAEERDKTIPSGRWHVPAIRTYGRFWHEPDALIASCEAEARAIGARQLLPV